MTKEATTVDYSELTTTLVSAYVSRNTIAPSELPKLISDTFVALSQLGVAQTEAAPEKLVPFVPIKKSVTPDYIICLEDGKKFKSLKRHLSSHFDMTPEQYRERWGLSRDYPMVAPNYSQRRSSLAKENRLGQKPATVSQAKPSRQNAGIPRNPKSKAQSLARKAD
jgi:predicted transcriptional regulator